jgi:signal recognition particle receptor subunit beta/predicted  nucleic acid-binding Zn-ribbon protein
MVIYNAATRELTAKIVYYGPGLCGKTTNLKVLHDRLEPGTAGKLLNLQTQTDRTIYFDLLPVELGDIKGYRIRFQLATVPGQTAFNETRRVVLKGVDGVVFVADSQWTMLPKNLESWQNLKDNLKTNGIAFEGIPVVVQYNKRDLADILAVDAMQEALGLSSYPFVEAVASAGRGVTETFKLISKLTFVDLLRRLQGRRPEEPTAPEAAAAPSQTYDDLQTWKDSLLKRESQPPAPNQRPSRPFSLVPPAMDEAPFDTMELGRGVDEDEGASPYAVPEPPQDEAEYPSGGGPAETVQMDAVREEEPADAEQPLAEAEEVEVEESDARETATDPAFLPIETAHIERLEVVEQRIRETEDRASREREAAERLEHAFSVVQERASAASEHMASLAEQLAAMERSLGGLHESVGHLMQRLPELDTLASRQADLESGLRGVESAAGGVQSALQRVEAGLGELDERFRTETNRQRKDADDVGMALRGMSEKTQRIEQQIAVVISQVGGHEDLLGNLRAASEKLPELSGEVETLLRAHRELEATLQEKTQQGRREAEDIRSQMEPLLEDRVRRHESDAHLFAEMERLRESLAESLHDLAERIRHAVRE